jgi:NAD(P)-dependent dehydrogenase (short-subunit alcohol dehydrogenase family)
MRRVSRSGQRVPDPIQEDMASLAAVARISRSVLAREPKLDVLMNNAGVQPMTRRLSPDGFELTFAVNHLAGFALTSLLARLISDSAGFVVTTASDMHAKGSREVLLPSGPGHWSDAAAYNNSKLANVLFTIEAPERLGLPALCWHPGAIRTPLNREASWLPVRRVAEMFRYRSPRVGADTGVWLANQSLGLVPPEESYYVARRPHPIEGQGLDRQLARQLWDTSNGLISGLTD